MVNKVSVESESFSHWSPKVVCGSFELSSVREIGAKIAVFEWSTSRGNEVWFELSGSHCSSKEHIRTRNSWCSKNIWAKMCHFNPNIWELNIETGSYSEKSVQMKTCLTTKMLLLLFLLLYNRCLTLKDFTFVVGLNKSEDLEQYSQLFVTRGVIRQRGIKWVVFLGHILCSQVFVLRWEWSLVSLLKSNVIWLVPSRLSRQDAGDARGG